VAISRLSDPALFKQTIKAYSFIQKVLDENKAIHVEIQQP
jgi:hypothetical protein